MARNGICFQANLWALYQLNRPGTCQTILSLQPNLSTVEDIRLCQARAQTPFCYPPNNTRICVPVDNIPIFWPPTFYKSNSEIALQFQFTDQHSQLPNNAGNATLNITLSIWKDASWRGSYLANEKDIRVQLVERKHGSGFDHTTYAGPDLIMMSTARVARPTITEVFPTPSTGAGKSGGGNVATKVGSAVGMCAFLVVVVGGTVLLCLRDRKKKMRARMEREQQLMRDVRRATAQRNVERTVTEVPMVRMEPERRPIEDARGQEDIDVLPPYPGDEPPKYTL
ncbi:hypothetical protein P154DRAFT_537875 [Amniculicola lignicola CBS 123094]|uniref:Uncharacterized protein n=1 Tax=Amniculicola lignicola CBS 123094 TaxID=1392246 RepID=A0A6A5W3K6_9PLEO|nr:hypothetical protein P154DRAFT_537875 [Amniculicola lignicola CBS 123094]